MQQMHLLSFMTFSPMNHTILSWASEGDNRLENIGSLKYWQDIARTLERGRFDGIFFADILGTYDRYKNRMDEALRYGLWWPTFDPSALMGAMAAATDHLGLAMTLSLSDGHPYTAVRKLSTLDYLSGGRIGWNIVTGAQRSEYSALGLAQTEHDERYDRGDEFMEIAKAYWDAFPPDALIADRKRQILADPERIGRVNFKGKYFSSRSVPPTFPSPQGRPVFFQAGASGRGQEFALKHADVIFAVQRAKDTMTQFMDRLRTKAAASGMETPKVVFGIQAILGSTEEEAKRTQAAMLENVPIEAALARMSASLGNDFDGMDLDTPFAEMNTQASQGLMQATASISDGKRLTLREAANIWSVSVGMPQLVGTPEQVAARMEEMWRESGCHGFNITPARNTKSVEDFVDHVVPILQERGVFRREYEGTTLSRNLLGRDKA